jgi:ABC-type branched-subunit amino acid transport system substrate-binding protein
MLASKPDALLIFTYGGAFGTVLRALKETGVDIPVFGSGANMLYSVMDQYASYLPRDLYFNSAHGVVADPSATAAVRRAQDTYFKALRAVDVRPEYFTAIPWDPTMIVIDAFRHLPVDVTASQFRDYILRIKGYAGIVGMYDFTTGNQRGMAQESAAVFQWDAARNDFVMRFPSARRR